MLLHWIHEGLYSVRGHMCICGSVRSPATEVKRSLRQQRVRPSRLGISLCLHSPCTELITLSHQRLVPAYDWVCARVRVCVCVCALCTCQRQYALMLISIWSFFRHTHTHTPSHYLKVIWNIWPKLTSWLLLL